MARITTAIRARVESILNSGVDTVNADSVKAESAKVGDSTAVTAGPLGDAGDVIPITTAYMESDSGTFSTNSTTYVNIPTNGGYIVIPPITNGQAKMRFSADVDVSSAEFKFGLANQTNKFGTDFGLGGQTTSVEIQYDNDRQPNATEWFDIPDDSRGVPLVKVRQPDGNDVFTRALMIQFGYEVE
jgi:hypothetical protein